VVSRIAGGGKFLDLSSHTLDIFDYLFGPVTKAAGNAINQAGLYEAEDMVCANLVFGNNIPATGTWCFLAFSDMDRNEIVGSKGKITFSTFGTDPIMLYTDNEIQELSFENPVHIQMPMIESIVRQLNGQGACPSTGESGARTSRVMDYIIKEFYSSCSYVESDIIVIK